MTEPIEPREAEAMAVTLGRVDIKVDNILEKVTEVRAEVIQHRDRLSKIESHVQQLQSDATAAAKDVVDAEVARQATAKLLKEATEKALSDAQAADDKKVLAAKQLVEQSTTTWSKRQTLAVIGGFILAIIVGVFGIVWAIKTGNPPSAVRLP